MTTENKENEKEKGNETIAPIPEESISTTSNSITIDGSAIAYTASTGTILIREEDEKEGHKAKASVFFTAYTKDDVDPATRPITFCFNGGPGSSSVWLHLGLFGPKRVLMDEKGNAPAPPYQLVDNEYSLLDKTDLVFIDPVSTGYSRAVPGEKADQFHEFKKDIASVAEFIRVYTSRNNRWSSPKFLSGESYGTTRAAGLSGYLQNEYGMFLNGILLISSVLEFQTLIFNTANDLPYIMFLPTYAATAMYHNKLADELQSDFAGTMAEVQAFAEGEYATALMQGNKLSAESHASIVTKLSRYTGLSAEFIENSNLRIEISRFCKELLRDQRRTVGRLDSRFLGIDRTASDATYEFDPSYINIQGVYTATFNDYIRRELGYETDLPYEILTAKVWPWNYKEFQNRFVDVAETLRAAMSRNQHLKVFVANGYYDLATPFAATEYTFSHLALDPSLADNVTMAYYDAGHMMYAHLPSLAKLKDDMATFIATALP